jgi:sulfur carrier protein ThiS
MRIRGVIFMSLVLAAVISACTADDTELPETAGGEFAIYALSGDLMMDDVVDLAQVELPEIPVLSTGDISAYASATHVIELEPSVAELLDALELPGRPFVVAVDRTPIYAGAFMAAYFSRSYDGVVILWPPMEGGEDTIMIQLGYPGADFFVGEDPRSDARILDALRQAGKLR